MRASPNRLLANIVAAVHLIIGIAGFFVVASAGFFSTSGGLLVGILGVNPLQNVVHILIGAALLLAGLSSIRASKAVNTVAGTGYLLLGLAGLFIIGTPLNVLALNGADNVLHFASAVVLLGVGLGADRSTTTAVTA